MSLQASFSSHPHFTRKSNISLLCSNIWRITFGVICICGLLVGSGGGSALIKKFISIYLPLGFFPVFSDFPVFFWAILAALALLLPALRSSLYVLHTLLPFGILDLFLSDFALLEAFFLAYFAPAP
jgi:hypothetical protein